MPNCFSVSIYMQIAPCKDEFNAAEQQLVYWEQNMKNINLLARTFLQYLSELDQSNLYDYSAAGGEWDR